jgi:polyisoprenoid-binding protein YceI
MRRLRWVLLAVAVVAVLVVVGPFVYIHVIQGDPPRALRVEDAASASASVAPAPASLDGRWTVTSGSQAGYRVQEVLFGQGTTAVGRTTAVTGELQLAGSTVTAATVTVDLTKVASDQRNRDGQFQGRIMQTATFPTATFVLAAPITLESVPVDGATATVTASGNLTLRGTTKPVTVSLTVKRTGGTVLVSGTIPVAFADFRIPDPSFGPAQVGDRGQIEFALAFAKA